MLSLSSCKRATVEVYDVPKQAAASAAPSPVADAPPSQSGKGWIQWTKPSAWTELSPTAFRKGNFVVEGENESKVEITVSSFPGSVGGTLANVNRWRGQAGLSPISNSELAESLTDIVVDGQKGQLVDIPPESDASDAVHIVAAIFLYEGESWFFKMSGPSDLVALQRTAFDQFIDGLTFTDTESKNETTSQTAQVEDLILAFDPPTGWTESEGSAFRIASYQIEMEGFAPADFSITSFPGEAGGLAANVNRWRQQLGLGPWNEAQVNANAELLNAGELEFMLFDLKPTTEREKSLSKERILAAILKYNDRSWFYKLKGDIFLVETHRSQFRQMVQSSQFESESSSN